MCLSESALVGPSTASNVSYEAHCIHSLEIDEALKKD